MLSWFDYLSLDFESKGPEVAVVDSPACNDLLFDVLSEGSDHEVKLRFGVEWLDRFVGSGL